MKVVTGCIDCGVKCLQCYDYGSYERLLLFWNRSVSLGFDTSIKWNSEVNKVVSKRSWMNECVCGWRGASLCLWLVSPDFYINITTDPNDPVSFSFRIRRWWRTLTARLGLPLRATVTVLFHSNDVWTINYVKVTETRRATLTDLSSFHLQMSLVKVPLSQTVSFTDTSVNCWDVTRRKHILPGLPHAASSWN